MLRYFFTLLIKSVLRFSFCIFWEVENFNIEVKKNLNDDVRFVDDVTKRNLELMSNLRNSYNFGWYYSYGIYGRTENGLQLKFGLVGGE
jgi:hypothetical protein